MATELKDVKVAPETAERIKFLLESPGGRILARLGRDITAEAVYEVEIVLLQHLLDRQIVKKFSSPGADAATMDAAELTDAAVEIGRNQEITGEPRCVTVPQYVATFFHSGAAGIEAQWQLGKLGLKALAEPAGIAYLRAKFPPAAEE